MVQASPALVLYVAKSDQATYNDRAQLTSTVSDNELDDLLIGQQSEIAPTGAVAYTNNGSVLTFTSSNGGSQALSNYASNNNNTQQNIVDAIVAAKLIGGASALFLKDDSSSIQAPTVDQARALYGLSFVPSNKRVVDYLGEYTSLAQGNEVIFQNSSGDEVTFMDANVTPGVISGGTFTNGDAQTQATITFPTDLSGYNLVAGGPYSNFLFPGAGAATPGSVTINNGITTFTATSNGPVQDANAVDLPSGTVSLSFDSNDTTNARLSSQATQTFAGTAGWYVVDTQYNTLSTTPSNPVKYAVVNNSNNPAILQSAVTINGTLGGYLNANFANGAREQLAKMGLPGSPVAATVNYGSNVYNNINFDDASQTIEALRAIRTSFMNPPTVVQLTALGAAIPLRVVFQLTDVNTYFVNQQFTSNNYATWAPSAEAAVPEGEANYIESPLGYYRANKTSQHAASNIIAMAIVVGTSSPTSLATLATFLGTSNVNVDQYDPVDGTFNAVSLAPVELWSRVQSGYTPQRNLQAHQWTFADIVQFGKDIGRDMNLTASGTSGVKTTFASLGATAKSELAKDVLQSYVDGTKSAVMKVVEALYNAGATSGTMDLNELSFNLLGGTASVRSPFTPSSENKMLSQAIAVYVVANPSKAGLADSLITAVLVRAQMMKQDKPSSDPWSAQVGLRIGASALSDGTVYNFTAPTQDANGILWSNVPAAVKVAVVGAIYNNIISISSFSYNTQEKASLAFNLMTDILGTGQKTNVWSELEKYISDKAVFQELIREKASSASNMLLDGQAGGALPLGLAALFTQINNTTNTPEDREEMVVAAAIVLTDFVDIQTNTSTMSSNMTAKPRATPADLGGAIATLCKKASLSPAELAAYMQALADMGTAAESDFQANDLNPMTEATYNGAVGSAIGAMASALGNYTTSAPSAINATEMTGSWANALRNAVAQLSPFLKHDKADLASIISALNTFAEFLIIIEYVSEGNVITPEQAAALVGNGIPNNTVQNALIAVPLYTGRQLTDTVLLKYLA